MFKIGDLVKTKTPGANWTLEFLKPDQLGIIVSGTLDGNCLPITKTTEKNYYRIFLFSGNVYRFVSRECLEKI